MGYEDLKAAIVDRAVKDYAAAFKGQKVDGISPEFVMSECKGFFLSEWFKQLAEVDGEKLIKKIEAHEIKKMKRRRVKKTKNM